MAHPRRPPQLPLQDAAPRPHGKVGVTSEGRSFTVQVNPLFVFFRYSDSPDTRPAMGRRARRSAGYDPEYAAR